MQLNQTFVSRVTHFNKHLLLCEALYRFKRTHFCNLMRELPSFCWVMTGVWVSFVYDTVSRGGKSTCVTLAIPSFGVPRLKAQNNSNFAQHHCKNSNNVIEIGKQNCPITGTILVSFLEQFSPPWKWTLIKVVNVYSMRWQRLQISLIISVN